MYPPNHRSYQILKALLLIGLVSLLGLGALLLSSSAVLNPFPVSNYDRYIQPMALYDHLEEDLHDLQAHMLAAQTKLGATAQQGDLDAAIFHLRALEEHKNALASLSVSIAEEKLLQQFQTRFQSVQSQTQVAMQLPADQLFDYLQQHHYFLALDQATQVVERLNQQLTIQINEHIVNEAKKAQAFQNLLFCFLLIGGVSIGGGMLGIHRAEAKLRAQSHQLSLDPVTQLGNLHQLEADLNQQLATASQHSTALLYIKLDGLDLIYQLCGHEARDEARRQFGAWLRNMQSPADRAYRICGDEFALLCALTPSHTLLDDSDSFHQQLKLHTFKIQHHVFQLSASIGIVTLSSQFQSASQLLQVADAACFAAKTEGKQRTHFYLMDAKAVDDRLASGRWIQQLKSALEHQTLVLYAQKIIPAHQQHKMLHCEILIRVPDENGQLVAPTRLLQAIEQHPLMSRIDHWVLAQTLILLGMHADKMDLVHTVSINLSAKSLSDPEFLFLAEQLFKKSVFPCEKICLEIAEATLIANQDQATQFMQKLHALGVKFSLDHFGTGIASFGYLKSLPIQFIKIDHQWVQQISTDEMSQLTIKSINDLTHTLHRQTIAEGVETPVSTALLRDLGVDLLQGDSIHKPEPLTELLNSLIR